MRSYFHMLRPGSPIGMHPWEGMSCSRTLQQHKRSELKVSFSPHHCLCAHTACSLISRRSLQQVRGHFNFPQQVTFLPQHFSRSLFSHYLLFINLYIAIGKYIKWVAGNHLTDTVTLVVIRCSVLTVGWTYVCDSHTYFSSDWCSCWKPIH